MIISSSFNRYSFFPFCRSYNSATALLPEFDDDYFGSNDDSILPSAPLLQSKILSSTYLYQVCLHLKKHLWVLPLDLLSLLVLSRPQVKESQSSFLWWYFHWNLRCLIDEPSLLCQEYGLHRTSAALSVRKNGWPKLSLEPSRDEMYFTNFHQESYSKGFENDLSSYSAIDCSQVPA